MTVREIQNPVAIWLFVADPIRADNIIEYCYKEVNLQEAGA